MLCPRCGSQLPEWTSRCDNCGLVLIETKVDVDRKGPYRIGEVVAERYELRDRAGAGPLFWTYLAFDQEEERPVALRAVRPTLLPSTQDHERFAAKVEPLLSLQAPGLARLLRVDRDENTTIVASELVDGLPLRALIQLRRQEGRAFSASETLAVLTSIADALENGVATATPAAHGDLRPPHVLVLDDRIRLEVFGLAAAFPTEETVRALKDDPEASGYLAPEVREGRVGDPRSDVYGLAILAGELLTGRVPPALGVGLDEFLRHVPPLSEEVLRKSLSPDLASRDATPSELVEALSAVLGAETWKPQVRRSGSSEPSFPKDPALPAEAAESGTIPAISPFAYLPPTPQGVVTVAKEPRKEHEEEAEPDETQRNEASAVARAVAALDDEAPVERDPAIAVQPAAEGTVQITADMIEPDSTLVALAKAADAAGAVERAPGISVQPAAEGTVQITADMIEPVEEDFVTSPRAQISPKPAAAAERAEGLDPRLVRAAKQLDKQRKTASTEPPETDPPEVEPPTARDEASPAAAATSEENVRTTVQRSKPWAPPPEAGRRAAAPRLEPLPSLEAEPAVDAGVAVRAAGPQAKTGATTDRPGLVRGFVGPIEIKTARGAVAATASGPQPAGAESPSPDEAQRLPAVMVDRSLTEAFGPPLVPEEPTYRVKREDAMRPPPQPSSRAHAGKQKSSVPWWQWLLFVALLTGALTLVGLGSLWLLNAG